MTNRITYDDTGHLDEVVTDGGEHLERMKGECEGGKVWWLVCKRQDGVEEHLGPGEPTR